MNTITPVGHVPEKSLEELIINATQLRLDTFARSRNYDNTISACSYATSTFPKFSAEGQYCVWLRDATWAKLYQILEDVQAGKRQSPKSVDEVIDELPIPAWPL